MAIVSFVFAVTEVSSFYSAYSLHSLYNAETAAVPSLISCSVLCNKRDYCASVIWEPDAEKKCQLVVHYSTEGAELSFATRIHRSESYRNKKLFEIRSDTGEQSFDWGVAECGRQGGKMVDYPMTKGEEARLDMRSQRYILIDLTDYDRDGVFENSDSTITAVKGDMEHWDLLNPSKYNGEDCFGYGDRPTEYWDWGCDEQNDVDEYAIFCTKLE